MHPNVFKQINQWIVTNTVKRDTCLRSCDTHYLTVGTKVPNQIRA
jgi:hypothetical protein